ncbi:acyl-CoA dehydrogenase [Sphingomonas koreensis]|jgi:acyl-CoA dehydrogenase|uniref:Cyclohexane-1-carbonyl-CoA dehydrogenase n=1 Tax=Sphingomonas koreensis TaxID=93064 RepID=A0A1L6JDI9_9SPHN|nr:acyl-CoA dehydrogenase family protein [Sphingomonas koreensis]APR53996.1 acyl-CoA dehydrogenase [Sphingomonas koreensis]MDC7808961.1 acyl-CoA dehydrogenase family protein [Sphingomonas koreensis]RSU19063.1 acyl-CoA dehydrogenase [Sphingomonas koreensis]RSU24139.1 acyl-CoA dehydrogenase [Sphingomonas koreensis]RSU26389.1 acyl-CoA dehydrogenase [Sphingomonas koreensis]
MALDPETFDALIDTVRRFVAQRLRPLESEVEAADAIPDTIVEEMKALGLFGLSIAEDYGGLGLTMLEECRVAIEMGRTTPAFRSTFGTNVGIGSQGLVMAGTSEQKAAWLPRIASGEIITSFALTEPDVGSDSGAVKARAVRDGDVYRLSGTKRFITNADKASLFTVMARTGDEPGARGVSAFLVPRDLPGISIGEPEKKMGQKGAKVADVIFDDVPVPAANRLGEEGEGFKIAMRVLDRGRLHISAVSVGVAERLIADCVAYACERKQFGKAIAEHQLIQAMLADSKTECLAARALVLETAQAKDEGKDVVMESAAAKLFATEMVGRVADRAVQIFGGAGYIEDYGIERLYRDVRLFRIYEGTSQIQQLIIARETLKRGG